MRFCVIVAHAGWRRVRVLRAKPSWRVVSGTRLIPGYKSEMNVIVVVCEVRNKGHESVW